MNNTEKAELCERMAEELRMHGHCTGSFQNSEGKLCLAGAGLVAMDLNPNYAEDFASSLMDIAEALGFASTNFVFQFNDGTSPSGDGKGIDERTAIDYCIDRAKYWRNQ